MFALQHVIGRLCSAELSEQLVSDELQVLCNEGDDKAVAESAVQVWLEFCGAPRQGTWVKGRVRSFVGKQHVWVASPEVETETSWLKRRRREVSTGSAAVSSSSSAPSMPQPSAVGPYWIDAHESESQFNDAKRQDRFIDLIDEGGALRQELAAGVEQTWQEHNLREAKISRDYLRTRRRLDAADAPAEPIDFTGKLVWLDGMRRAVVGGFDTSRRMNFRFVDQPVGCHIVVCRNASAPDSLQAIWNLCILGGISCTPDFLTSASLGGSALKFNAACEGAARFVYISLLFATYYESLAEVVFYSCLHPKSKWTNAGEQIDFREKIRKSAKSREQSMAFLVDAEIGSEEFNQVRFCYTMDTAPAALMKYDLKSFIGVCGT